METDYRDYIQSWISGISSEIDFWENEVMKEDGYYHEKVMNRYIQDNSFKLEDEITDNGGTIKFCDVGSGPFSRCGFVSNKAKVEAIAVDPLADAYIYLKNKYNMDNQIDLKMGFAEFLDKLFAENSFDMVHMSNSLDHAFDPIIGIFQLLYICKIGGKVILRHHENEAENERYVGFHQWNLSVHNEENAFVIWRKDCRYNINEIFEEYADIEIYPDEVEKGGTWVFNKIVLTKKHRVSIPENNYHEIFCKEIYIGLIKTKLYEQLFVAKFGMWNQFSRDVRMRIAELRQRPKVFLDIIDRKKIKKLDIYGAGKIGRDFYSLCNEAGVKVGTLIDRNIDNVGFLPIVLAENYYPKKDVDAVVVTIDQSETIKSLFVSKGIGLEIILDIKDVLGNY